MSARNPNPNLVKMHRTYSVEEAALRLGLHKNTVHRWIKHGGLKAITDERPYLIPGEILKVFLTDRRQRNRQKCQPGEFYCLRCRAPRDPAGNFVEFNQLSATHGQLHALCAACEGLMNRATRIVDLARIPPGIEVLYPAA